jgi:hypothetical protein
MIALILCIVGGIDEADSSASEITTGKNLTKGGVILFIFVYIILFALAVITMKDVGNGVFQQPFLFSDERQALDPILHGYGRRVCRCCFLHPGGSFRDNLSFVVTARGETKEDATSCNHEKYYPSK